MFGYDNTRGAGRRRGGRGYLGPVYPGSGGVDYDVHDDYYLVDDHYEHFNDHDDRNDHYNFDDNDINHYLYDHDNLHLDDGALRRRPAAPVRGGRPER